MKGNSNKRFKPNKGNNGKKGNPHNNKYYEDPNKGNDKPDGSNDPMWYAQDAALLRQAASIPFSWSTGTISDLNIADPIGISAGTQLVAPGCIAFRMMPSVGYATSPTDPINIAAFSVYSYVRHANAGSANYDAPDLMCYLIAMANIYAAINHLMRIYGTSRLYSTRNRYMPRALLDAMGADYDDVVLHQADLRYGINMLINKAASFATPANMTYFNRYSMLYRSLYTEGTSPKDQIYLYTPAAFYRYNGDTAGPTAMTAMPWTYASNSNPTNSMTVDAMLTFVDNLLNPLMQSEDFNIMSGDILKAYGDSGIWKLTSLPEDYVVTPEFNIGVLEQMRNIDLLPFVANTVQGITTANGYIVSTPQLSVPDSEGFGVRVQAAATCRNKILETTTADVTPELVIESTRCKTGVIASRTSNATVYQLHTGSEFCQNAFIYVYANSQSASLTRFQLVQAITMNLTSPSISVLTDNLNAFAFARAFKFAPTQWIIWYNTSGSEPSVQQVIQFETFDNYAVLTPEEILRMHEAALLSMFKVPYIGAAKA